MSVSLYLGKNLPEVRMPRGACEEIGAVVQGPVLEGDRSAAQVRMAETMRAVDPGGEFYGSVEDYDPVLRFHCRL